jgi:glycerol kinase
MAILAIDQGTSGTKALIRADGGELLAVEEVPVRPTYDGDRVEIDPMILFDSIMEAAKLALDAAGNPNLRGVSLSNMGETVLAWDPETGEPLSQAIIWQDRRAETICHEICDQSEWIAERTGLVLSSYFAAPKMAWIRRNVTDNGVVTMTDAWYIKRLANEFVTDAETASSSLIVDIDRLEWDADLLATFNLQDEALPRIARNDEVVGVTSAFGAEVPLCGLVLDQQAAMVAQSCLVPGSLKCTYGTGAFMFGNAGPQAVRSPSGLTTRAAWKLRDRTEWCLDGQVYAAGSALRWLVDLGLLSAPQALDAESAPASGGVKFIPALAGLAAPWWSAKPDAAFLGMGLSTTRGNLVRSVLESIAAQVAIVARNAADEMGQPLERLRVDGGLTRSSVMCQVQADLIQIPVDVYPSPHATALGAALMGELSLNETGTLEQVVPSWKPVATYEPQWSADQAAEFLAEWNEAIEASIAKDADR